MLLQIKKKKKKSLQAAVEGRKQGHTPVLQTLQWYCWVDPGVVVGKTYKIARLFQGVGDYVVVQIVPLRYATLCASSPTHEAYTGSHRLPRIKLRVGKIQQASAILGRDKWPAVV